MSLDQVIQALVSVTLIELMVTVGLGLSVVELVGIARDWRLLARAALANYVCVPAVTMGLLLLFNPPPIWNSLRSRGSLSPGGYSRRGPWLSAWLVRHL